MTLEDRCSMDRTTVQLYRSYLMHDRKVQPGKAANLFAKGGGLRAAGLFMTFATCWRG